MDSVLGDERPIKTRFADSMPPGLETGREQAGELASTTEDVLSYILFPPIAELFFENRAERQRNRSHYKIEKLED